MACLPLAAQTEVKVYSEFRRVTPAGTILKADQGGRPREILSPGVPRQGFASFRIAVTAPPGRRYSLFLGENPENFFQLTLYKESWTKSGQEWIADKLEKVDTPYHGVIPESPAPGAPPAQTVDTFWLDVYTPSQAAVRRVRLEAQLNVGEDWVIYPLEVRVLPARLPRLGPFAGAVPPVTAPAGEAALDQLASYLCGAKVRPGAGPPTARQFVARNAQHDMALAREIEEKKGREAVQAGIASALGAEDVKSWCAERLKPAVAPYNPEQYLRVRDWLFKTAAE